MPNDTKSSRHAYFAVFMDWSRIVKINLHKSPPCILFTVNEDLDPRNLFLCNFKFCQFVKIIVHFKKLVPYDTQTILPQSILQKLLLIHPIHPTPFKLPLIHHQQPPSLPIPFLQQTQGSSHIHAFSKYYFNTPNGKHENFIK